MRRTIVNAKGQVTIPAELRGRLGIKTGTRVTWSEAGPRLILAPMTKQLIASLMGFLKPPMKRMSAFEASFRERARERKREKS